MKKLNLKTVQNIIMTLQNYWSNQGCTIISSLDIEIGAGTAHPITYLRTIGPEPIAVAYVQPTRRPSDGRYGKSTHKLQYYHQFQVIIKPSPDNIQKLYLNSLKKIGISYKENDIKFVEDNWENITLGANGLGWEVWLNGMEITQFTYFQQMGCINCKPITSEITYGIERIAIFLQNVNNVYDLIWNENNFSGVITYKDLFYQNEFEQSYYNFKYANINFLFSNFELHEKETNDLLNLNIPLIIPAYEHILKSIHNFNILDARKAISITEKQYYIMRIRVLIKKIALLYYNNRKKLGFPMCKKK